MSGVFDSIVIPKLSAEQMRDMKAELKANLKPVWRAVKEERLNVSAPSPNTTGVSDSAMRTLYVVAVNWFRPMEDCCAATNLSADAFDNDVEELLGAGLVTKHRARTFIRGGQIFILLPTKAGLERLRNARANYMSVRGDAPNTPKGDGTHIFYQNRIAAILKKAGWSTEIERCLNTKRVDVGASMDNGKILHAYEVVNSGLEKELDNVRQDLEDGWHLVVLCIGETEAEEKKGLIRNELEELIGTRLGMDYLQKVEFKQLRSFR